MVGQLVIPVGRAGKVSTRRMEERTEADNKGIKEDGGKEERKKGMYPVPWGLVLKMKPPFCPWKVEAAMDVPGKFSHIAAKGFSIAQRRQYSPSY
jgi:hypothetical protein